MKKQYGRKPSADKPDWQKKESNSSKSDFHKKKYAGDKQIGGGGERKFGDKPFVKKSFGDKPERGERNFGDKPFVKKSFGDKPERGERKFGDKPFVKKSFGDKPERGERKFGDKPYVKKSFGDKPERGERKFGEKPYVRKSFGDKPDFKKSYGDKPDFKKPYGDREDRRRKEFGDKPFLKKNFGDKPYEKKPFASKEGSFGRPFKKKTFEDRKHLQKPTSSEKSSLDKPKNEEWQVFENAEDAKAFIKSNRNATKDSGNTKNESPKEYKNDNLPLRATGYNDKESSIRLNRFIANTGICSRREADDLIEAGVVKVNGKIVTSLGTKVGPGDSIHYGDQLLRREKMSYVLLNKPKDYITTTDDPQERKTVMSLIEEAGKERVYPVGRLDRNTTGLLLFTNDGDLAQRLTHPKNGVRKIYHVSLDKNLKTDDFEKILKGFEMEDGFMKADELSFVGDGLDKKEVGIVIHSGRNRIVRRIFEGLGYDVVKLDRVLYAGLTKKNLPRGRFRHLTTEEVGILRMQIGGEKKPNVKKADPKHNKGKRPRK